MIAYRQTLDELFNIMTMCLPIDRLQRVQFIAHFTASVANPAPGGPSKGDFNTDVENWFQLVRPDGSNLALISAYELMPPKFHKQSEFDLTFAQMQFEQYFATQEKTRGILARQQQEKLNKELGSTPDEYFNNINKPKPVRNISSAGLFPEINYGEFKIAPNIPNIGKASL